MGGKYPPIKHKDAVRGVKKLGFVKRKSKATSHEQWVSDNPFRKVTLDKHHSPYCGDLLNSIIKQAGVSRKEFYKACFGK